MASKIVNMPGSRWFAHVLMEASYASEPIVLEELELVLDAARPTKIDPTKSYAIDGSFFIAHAEDCWGDIDIEVGEDHADLMHELGSQHIGSADFGQRWTQQLAAEVERVIRGHYQIDWVRWRGRVIHTTVTNLHGNTIRDAGSMGTAAYPPTKLHPRAIPAGLRMQAKLNHRPPVSRRTGPGPKAVLERGSIEHVFFFVSGGG